MDYTYMEQEIGTRIKVAGYRILVKAPSFETKTKGGILLTQDYTKEASKCFHIGKVIAMGKMCYQPEEKFGGERYCEVGDWVIYSAYERDKFPVGDHLCFWLNDERIYGVALNPEDLIPQLKAMNVD